MGGGKGALSFIRLGRGGENTQGRGVVVVRYLHRGRRVGC